ncbi:hypothetical protein EV2_039451 [Malus domestica]
MTYKYQLTHARVAEEAYAVMALKHIPSTSDPGAALPECPTPSLSRKSIFLSPSPSWPRPASAILSMTKSSKPLAWTTSMRTRSSPSHSSTVVGRHRKHLRGHLTYTTRDGGTSGS